MVGAIHEPRPPVCTRGFDRMGERPDHEGIEIPEPGVEQSLHPVIDPGLPRDLRTPLPVPPVLAALTAVYIVDREK
ncbi:MAG TPA: hypothetical protein HA256_08180 [Methanoregulaceae archaeon]|nr:hypothetical protein [Methanoregulaceae archaeon]